MIPDKPADAKGQPAEQEEHETIMHGASAVTSRGDEIQRGADFAHLPNVVNAEGDDSKQKIFKQSTFGSETVLPDWVLGLSHRLLRHGHFFSLSLLTTGVSNFFRGGTTHLRGIRFPILGDMTVFYT